MCTPESSMATVRASSSLESWLVSIQQHTTALDLAPHVLRLVRGLLSSALLGALPSSSSAGGFGLLGPASSSIPGEFAACKDRSKQDTCRVDYGFREVWVHVAGGTTALGVRDGLLRERSRCGDASASLANFGLNY